PPRGPAGTRRLSVDAQSVQGDSLPTLHAELDVRSPFLTGQAASIVIGQAGFEGGEPRQDLDAATAAANTLDTPASPVAWSAGEEILYIADTGDSRVLGFNGVPTVNNANAAFVLGQI